MTITIKKISPTSYGIFEGEKLRHTAGDATSIINFCKSHYGIEPPHECRNTPTGTNPFLTFTDGKIKFEPISNKLRELRCAKKMTQTELAQLAGTTQSRLGEYERGDKPLENMTVGQAKKIADALGVKIDDLIGR